MIERDPYRPPCDDTSCPFRKLRFERAGAQFDLGVYYEKGRGDLPKDERGAPLQARRRSGNADGQVNLGVYYAKGLGGLPKDEREALRLYKLAAARADATARKLTSRATASTNPAIRNRMKALQLAGGRIAPLYPRLKIDRLALFPAELIGELTCSLTNAKIAARASRPDVMATRG